MNKRRMRLKMNKKIATVVMGLCFLQALVTTSKASVTINYDVGEITSGLGKISTGTLFFISHGTDNLLNSSGWTTGSSFILGDDSLFAAVEIANGVAQGALSSYALPATATSNTTKFSAIFLNGVGSNIVDYATGALKIIPIGSEPSVQLAFSNNASLRNAGTYQYGNYRTDSIEGFGAGPSGNMAWIFPADGATLSLSAYSGTGDYKGQDITASLSTTASVIIIPEPSSISLMSLGLMGLAAMRLRRKS